jgi:hypothetical protein
MKYYSESLKKLFDTPEQLQEAETEALLANQKTELTKKELSNAIEKADLKLDEAYKNYDAVREAAAKILDESNKQVEKMLKDAKQIITSAEQERTNAIVEFNKQFGTYKFNYTGDRAKRESQRVNKMVEDLFSMLAPFGTYNCK